MPPNPVGRGLRFPDDYSVKEGPMLAWLQNAIYDHPGYMPDASD